jgi:hypothetical protein
VSELTDDRIALRYLVEAYARAADTRDAALVVECFVDGGTLTVHWLDREATTMCMPGDAGHIPRGLSRYDRTMHFVGNHHAEIDGDRASGETYCVAHHITGLDDHVMGIRYEDTYRREPVGWKFVDRHLRLVWTQDTTVNG